MGILVESVMGAVPNQAVAMGEMGPRLVSRVPPRSTAVLVAAVAAVSSKVVEALMPGEQVAPMRVMAVPAGLQKTPDKTVQMLPITVAAAVAAVAPGEELSYETEEVGDPVLMAL
jgi:hypothetical protein